MSKMMGSRREQLTQQEKLIEQRKKEIELKLSQSTNKCDLKTHVNCDDEKSVATVEDVNDNVTIDAKDIKKETEENEDTDFGLNRYKNDGSFLAQFMAMQNGMKLNHVKVKAEIQPDYEKRDEKFMEKKNIKMKLNPIQSLSSKLKVVSSPESSTVVFDDDDDDDDDDANSEDNAQRLAIEKTAITVVVNGNDAEETMRQSMASNPEYRWLCDKETDEYKYFTLRIKELGDAKERAQNEGLMNLEIKNEPNTSSDCKQKRRKTRWSDEKVTPEVNLALRQDPALIQYAIQVYSTTDLSSEQWKQLDDQRKMRLLYDMLKAKQKQNQLLSLAGKVKYEYDSDEEAEDGTWEHKRRKFEMEKTQSWAEELTDKAQGKHHIGDFLPPEELEKFMERWELCRDGIQFNQEIGDYDSNKLQSDNLGYKMLQKLGWNEGESLGNQQSGITAPINKAVVGFSNAGLGQLKPDELQQGDDEYEAYRKRMMLAYRFRPNPLNNPRRAYY